MPLDAREDAGLEQLLRFIPHFFGECYNPRALF
jgi:hypothetical protein